METYQIISWLRDKAVRADHPSWERMMMMAAKRLEELVKQLKILTAERDALYKRVIELEGDKNTEVNHG